MAMTIKMLLQVCLCILHIKSSLQIRLENLKCKSRPLPVATSSNLAFSPSYVELHRCSGANLHKVNRFAKMECKPSITEVLGVVVFNRISNKEQNISLVNHTSCVYACALNRSSCSTNQIWNNKTCSCDCKFTSTKSCVAPHQWNSIGCACACPLRNNMCRNKLKDFNSSTCMCTCKASLRRSCNWKFEEDTCHCANYTGLIRTDKALMIMAIEMFGLLVIFALIINVIIYKRQNAKDKSLMHETS